MSEEMEVDRRLSDLSRQATAWLVQLDDEPDDNALREQFGDWLAADPSHRAAWQETVRVSELLSAAGSMPATMQTAHLNGYREFARARTLAVFGLAACLAWIFAPDLSLRLRSDAMTSTAELRVVRLEDGSVAHLAPDTAIAFANGPRGRTLTLLQGEVWFDVAHDAARPFRVTAGTSTVTVLGTAFSVGRYDTGTQVAVQRGHVAVTTADDATKPGPTELVAGQSLSLRAGTALRGTIRPDRVASWREGVAIVDDQPIGDVIDRLRPWYKGYIVTRGPGLTSRRVSGIYDLRDPDLALEALTKAHKVAVSHISPWLRIVTIS